MWKCTFLLDYDVDDVVRVCHSVTPLSAMEIGAFTRWFIWAITSFVALDLCTTILPSLDMSPETDATVSHVNTSRNLDMFDMIENKKPSGSSRGRGPRLGAKLTTPPD
ncbi:hypothetical protein N7539_008961 [Penicillium diatomitis]|uniref:Uncharacterized protein n=1 Tax=Penicillium diatomitis TaxID=2819901 RepID=A0A9X0BJF7_9EURO|nr:uncharacterized protein N7539_008961 [Penicillium diatomitis]KAJ5469343.1 hypothetical protein N7539_008961 [Penicillium diatomitis]